MIRAKDRVISTGESLNELSIGMLEHFIAMKQIRGKINELAVKTGMDRSHVPEAVQGDRISVFDMNALTERYNKELHPMHIADRIVMAEGRLGRTKEDQKEGLRPALMPFSRVVTNAEKRVQEIFDSANRKAAADKKARSELEAAATGLGADGTEVDAKKVAGPTREADPGLASRLRSILSPEGGDDEPPSSASKPGDDPAP